MAKLTARLPEDFLRKISTLGERTDEIASKALTEGGGVVLAQTRANLLGSIGKGPGGMSRSTGQLVAALGLTPVRVDRNGNYNVKIGFDEGRPDGVSNALIANVLEYGKHGQPARPFLKPAKTKSKAECLRRMQQVIEEEVKKL